MENTILGKTEKDNIPTALTLKRTNALRETFGCLKLTRSTEDILREVDNEGWDE